MADPSSDRPTARTQGYNIVTAIMLALTAVSCCVVLYVAASAAAAPSAQEVAAEPTLFVIPTFTPTLEGPTVNPTWTPGPTSTSTMPPTITNTPTETVTPSPTLTDTPTETATATETPIATLTPVPTDTPIRLPFDYVLREGVTYTRNFANQAGCDWAGIAGQVFDQQGRHRAGVVVHVTGGGLDVRVVSGSNRAYGESGWEVYLDNKPKVGTFFVQLETSGGQALSERITVQTIDSCDSNLALLTFDKVQ